jgi:hypothetical protein
MSLFFLISGLFAWPSLVRKGAAGFFRDRLLRLGLPFVVAAGLLAPLAYYPAHIQTGADPHPGAFLRVWTSLGAWPAGPAWFLWVLLAFGGVAAAAFRLWPGWGAALGRLTDRLARRPAVWCGALIAASALTYLPMAALFRPDTWSHLGPFWVQTSRLLHYAVYFVAGVGLGAAGGAGGGGAARATATAGATDAGGATDTGDEGNAAGADGGLLARDGRLPRRWPLWVLAALGAYGLAVVTIGVILQSLQKGGPSPGLVMFGNVTFVLSCACASMACLAVFVRFARRDNRATESFGANAYGIYLLHYLCVSWLQLALLHADLPAAVKWLAVTAGAVAVSWSLSAALRRMPGVARVL